MNQEDFYLYTVANSLFTATLKSLMRDKDELSQIPNKSLDAKNLARRQELERTIKSRTEKLTVYSDKANEVLNKYFPCNTQEEPTN